MPDRAPLPNEIWIGDLLTAWEACHAVSPADRFMVASLLGFSRRSEAVADQLARIATEPASPKHRPVLRQSEPSGAVPAPAQDVAARLVVVDRRMSELPSVSETAPGPELPLETPAHVRYEPPLEPLFETQYQRQILYALSATMAPEGDPDIESLVNEIAHGRPVRNARRKPVLTLLHGVQLLLDRGDGMMLFFGDQRALLSALRRLVGPERLQLLHFSECPARGAGPGSRRGWTRYQPPPPRTKVVVVSDFGIGAARGLQQRATAAEWLAFAELLRGAECDLVGLVPYPPGRWPPEIAAGVRLVQWDRPTRFSVVRQRSPREHAP